MDDKRITTQELSIEEEKEMREGMALNEMVRGAGWQVVKGMLEDMAFHTWIDPRSIEGAADSQKEWMWRELNAFHAANNAKEIIESISKLISRSEYLQKVKLGEINRQKMRI